MRYARRHSARSSAGKTVSRPAAPAVSAPSARRRRRFAPRRKNSPGIPLAIAAAAAVFLLIFVIAALARRPSLRINKDDLAAFRIPYEAITSVYDLSLKYNISFPRLLTAYSLDNMFFPPGYRAATDPEEIERAYILNYDGTDQKYPASEYAEYNSLMNTLFSEIRAFPIDLLRFSESDFMYGDSFGAVNAAGEKGRHYGTDIIDRQSAAGRIDVLSMTEGSVSASGHNRRDGYFVTIASPGGTVYRYARLDSLAAGLKPGDPVGAGQTLGKMGYSGGAEKTGAETGFPACVHIDISPKTKLVRGKFYINPYYILRLTQYRYAPIEELPPEG